MMREWLAQYYNWFKAFHIIAVIAWMAGMLYLPRLFVYHAGVAPGSAQSETFKVMEWRLLRLIINPAMGLTWLLGFALVWLGGWESAHWMWAKFILVMAMSAVHGFFVRCVKDFAADGNTRSQKFYRFANEIPTALLILIVILVVVKPL